MRPADFYDLLNPWDASDDFYLGLMMRADRVIDVGCGTGALLHRAREHGHGGHLIGIDPDADMLAVARRRADMDWRAGTAEDVPPADADLITMTGHAFQTLVEPAELDSSLHAISDALAPNGRFAFDTRNPAVEPWRHWGGEFTVVDDTGRQLTVVREVVTAEAGVVEFDETFSMSGETDHVVTHSALRFLQPDEVHTHLSAVGLTVEQQFGDWMRRPLESDSPEIITIARRHMLTSAAS
ncbi:class I SAM-dependent methyltransferase [Williamsia sp. MIQD14]|uniref:class I SAM-dependent methyltransferase n=1 Tax=Williamsia sp. MIQD14 TaxID=3425703 RepID=UPI003DA187C2